MQLHFTVPQLQLLAEILSEQKGPVAEDLLDRVLAKDLRFDFDELEQLGALVNAGRAEIVAEFAHAANPATATGLAQKRLLADEMLERLSEASAMV